MPEKNSVRVYAVMNAIKRSITQPRADIGILMQSGHVNYECVADAERSRMFYLIATSLNHRNIN